MEELTVVRIVRVSHLNSYGTLYGGWMMRWIVDAASALAVRFSKGPAVLGYVDDLHFLNPVYPGELVFYKARVEYVGNSSMGISVGVWAENPRRGERRPTTFALLSYVAIDEKGRPRKLGIEPWASKLGEEFRKVVKERIADRRERAKDVEVDGFEKVGSSLVREEHLVYSNLMYAGYLLYQMDEIGSAVSLSYAKKPTVTACLDRMAFYTPINKGSIIHYYCYTPEEEPLHPSLYPFEPFYPLLYLFRALFQNYSHPYGGHDVVKVEPAGHGGLHPYFPHRGSYQGPYPLHGNFRLQRVNARPFVHAVGKDPAVHHLQKTL